MARGGRYGVPPPPSQLPENVWGFGAQSRERAGDRGRTGDVQLGKLIEEGPEDHDPWG